ncbi:hypothetical protein [Sorangium sp. So ce145]|uniref:hypothetical protein n=1 Tax=Sorangium sp. So ce145 TaxID=3133285 RepID=UPI003F5EF00C
MSRVTHSEKRAKFSISSTKSSGSKPRHRGTKEATKPRRQSSKRPAGKPRAGTPDQAPRPTHQQARASSADRPSARSAITKALRGVLKLAEGFGAREDGSGPATLAQLVLRTLLFMLERADEPRLLAYQRAVLAFSEAVRAASSSASEHVDGAGRSDGSAPSPPGGHDDRGPARRPCEPAAEHLRAIGFKRNPSQDVWDAELADLIPHLFPGEWDPVHAILQSIERDAMLIHSAVRDPDGDLTPEIDMGLYALSERARVVRVLYQRVLAARKGGRS